MAFDSRIIANKVLQSAWQQEIVLKKMQLIKLVYFVHGWSLAMFDSSVVEDMPEAWQIAPVYPKIYRELSGYTTQSVNMLLMDSRTHIPFDAKLDSKEQGRLIADITNHYGNIDAFTLSLKTSEADTPYDLTIKKHGKYSIIKEDLMLSYFERKRIKLGLDKNYYNNKE